MIDFLLESYYFYTFNGRQYEIPLLVMFLLILAFSTLVLGFILHRLTRLMREGPKEEAENPGEAPAEPSPEFLVWMSEDEEELIPQKTLDALYAEKKGLIVCPFCETFNNPGNTQCTACAQNIQE